MITGDTARILGYLLSLLLSCDLVGVKVICHCNSVGYSLFLLLNTVLLGDGGGCHVHDLVDFVCFVEH